MKLKNYLFALLCSMAFIGVLSSCSDDDNPWDPKDYGSNIDMPKQRGFILNEGSYNMNNAHLNFFNFLTDDINKNDIYLTQNGMQIGDTGQDIIEYDDNIYLVAYGSKIIIKMNEVAKEEKRLTIPDEIGEPRFLVGSNGYIYATCYGGYVVKIDANTLEIKGRVQVGDNPEQIIEEDGYIYCVNSGWGYDNRLSVIEEKTFTLKENVEIMANPQAIVESDGYIVIQGYGGAYPNYTYPVEIYNPATKTCTKIGEGTNIAAEDGILYVVNTTTDYSTTPYSGTTEVWSYNLRTGKKTENALQLPDDLKRSCTYGISINEKTNHVYILKTNYTWGDGEIYHFDNKGKYIGKFSSGGQNPKKIVFID